MSCRSTRRPPGAPTARAARARARGPAPGDFSDLHADDPQRASSTRTSTPAPFSFKANCRATSTARARPAAPRCEPPEREPQSPVDYLAKDFASFRQALSDFSAPALSRLGRALRGGCRRDADGGAERRSPTSSATSRTGSRPRPHSRPRRSGVAAPARAARRLRAQPGDASRPRVLQLDASAGPVGSPAGDRHAAAGARARRRRIDRRRSRSGSGWPIRARPRRRRQLHRRPPVEPPGLVAVLVGRQPAPAAAGSTRFWLTGQGLGLYPGQQLLIDSPAADQRGSARPRAGHDRRVDGGRRPLIGEPSPLTRSRPGSCPRPSSTTSTARRSPGTSCRRCRACGRARRSRSPTRGAAGVSAAPVVVRAGGELDAATTRGPTTATPGGGPLAWLAVPGRGRRERAAPRAPEISLTSANPASARRDPGSGSAGCSTRHAADAAFTLTPERYSPVGGIGGTTWFDYDGDGGTRSASATASSASRRCPGTVFTVTYLVGGGSAGQRPGRHDRHTSIPASRSGPTSSSVTNPFPATGGADEETAQQIRDRAPQAFRAKPLRAVRPSDYAAAAESLPWVRQAGTAFRWTGSWLTVFTTADPAWPRGPTIAELESLTELLDRRRLAGYEATSCHRAYASVDLQITRLRAARRVRQRRRGGRARRGSARAGSRTAQPRLLRPRAVAVRRAAGGERAARRRPVRERCARA